MLRECCESHQIDTLLNLCSTCQLKGEVLFMNGDTRIVQSHSGFQFKSLSVETKDMFE